MHNLSWERIVLPNGLRLLLFPRLSNATAQLSVAIAYGSNRETESTSGMAHFLEHMVAGGSMRRIELSQSIEKTGGYADFSTANEDTMIVTDILPDKIDQTSETLIELLSEPNFEEEKVRSERKIILHEIAEVKDDPWSTVDELLRKSLFKMHPVRLPVLGFHRTVSRITLSMLEDAYRTHYTPQNMTLVLTGNFSDKDVESVSQKFGSIPKHQTATNMTPHTEESSRLKDVIREKVGIIQTYLSIGARTVPAKNVDTPALDIIDTLMGAGASSRLFVELREKRALAYSIESGHGSGSDYGYFHIDCAIETKRLEKAKKLIYKEIAKLRETKISTEELNKAKDMISGSILRTIDSPVDFPETLVNMEMQYGSETALMDYLTRIKSLSADDIVEVANKYLAEDTLLSVAIVPN